MKKVFFIAMMLSVSIAQAAIIYVDINSPSLIKNGQSWNTAYTKIAQACFEAEDGDQIWVAQGNYYNQSIYNPCAPFPFEFCVEYAEGGAIIAIAGKNINVYGGFQGTETSINQRNPALYETVAKFISFPQTGSALEGNLLVDGFTFNGYGVVLRSDRQTSIEIHNCKFHGVLDYSLIKVWGVNDLREITAPISFENCTIESYSGSHLNDNAGPTYFTDCIIKDCTQSPPEGTAPTSFIAGCEFHRCTFSNMDLLDPFEECLIWNSLIENSNFDPSGGNWFSGNNGFLNSTIVDSYFDEPMVLSTFANCIVWSNTSSANPIIDGNTCTVNFCIVQDYIATGSGNAITDPEFEDAASGNYRLTPCSKAVNIGFGPGGGSDDLDGNTRLIDGTVDAGCYEFQGDFPERIYVKTSPSGNGSGGSWANAMGNLHTALAMACPRTEIWVAAGTYKPSTNDRTISFEIPEGVVIYGGFAGTETSLSQRDYLSNITYLSGAIGAGGIADNSYHVVEILSADDQIVIDGIAIINGNANGAGSDGYGAGVLASFPNVLFRNCFIGFNNATNGAGIHTAGSGNFILDNVIFASNATTGNGGAIRTTNIAGLRPVLSVDRCTFRTNSAGNGGAIYSDATLLATNSLFYDNSASSTGGGVTSLQPNSFIANSTFHNNSPSAIQSNNSGLSVVSNIFQNHSADIAGSAAIKIYNLSDLALIPGTGNIVGDANFVNEAGDDFHLNAGSPALNAGAFYGTAPLIDFDGNDRVIGGQVDIGAFENQTGCFNPYDNCSEALMVDLDDYGLSLSMSCAINADAVPTSCANPAKSIWVKMLIPVNGAQFIASPVTTNGDVQIDLYVGQCGSLQYVTCVNNNPGGSPESLIIPAYPIGTEAFIRISSPNAILNDVLIYPIELPCIITSVLGVGDYGPCYNGPSGIAVFDQEITVTYDYEPYGGFLVIETPNGQDQFFQATGSPQTVVVTGLPATGNTVSLSGRFAASNYDGCYVQWPNVIPAPCCQPDNDECEFAQQIEYNTLIEGSTRCATVNNWFPASCILYQGRDLWYTFQATTSAVQIDMTVIEEISGPVNPRFTVFSGSCGNLTEVGCGNEYFEGFDETAIIEGLTPGQYYYLRASMYNDQAARFNLFLTEIESTLCPGDFNNDGTRNSGDLLVMLGEFGCSSNCTTDLNNDQVINSGDLIVFLGYFGINCN